MRMAEASSSQPCPNWFRVPGFLSGLGLTGLGLGVQGLGFDLRIWGFWV